MKLLSILILVSIDWAVLKDVLIASPQGISVNPQEEMTSNGSRARDYGGCCGARSTETVDWMDRKDPSQVKAKILGSGMKEKEKSNQRMN